MFTTTEQPSLAVTTAQRLARFVRTEFDPKSDESWATADKLWRAALLSRDAERTAPPAPIVNFVSTRTGKVRAVCEFCDCKSGPVEPARDGEPSMWDLPRGWWCAPYPRDFVHEDGSTGTLFTCPNCDKRLDKGESLFPHESRRAARQVRAEGRQS